MKQVFSLRVSVAYEPRAALFPHLLDWYESGSWPGQARTWRCLLCGYKLKETILSPGFSRPSRSRRKLSSTEPYSGGAYGFSSCTGFLVLAISTKMPLRTYRSKRTSLGLSSSVSRGVSTPGRGVRAAKDSDPLPGAFRDRDCEWAVMTLAATIMRTKTFFIKSFLLTKSAHSKVESDPAFVKGYHMRKLRTNRGAANRPKKGFSNLI